jgi:hypothetical protein
MLIWLAAACSSSGPGLLGLELSVSADISSGSVPAVIGFTADTDPAATITWSLDGETLGEGSTLSHTFRGSGSFEVVATATLDERAASAAALVAVTPATCPTAGTPSSSGQVTDTEQTEISGVAASAQWPGIFWVIEDAGNPSELVAIDTTGAVVAVFDLPDATARDWEDIGLGPDGTLYLADIGDNDPLDRDQVVIAMLPEPDPNQEDGDLETTELKLSYADGLHDAEAMAVDPVTGDLWIATKDYDGPAHIYTKAAPHLADSETVLTEQAYLDFSVEPLSGSSTTGAAFSPLGDLLAIRTYNSTAYLFRVDRTHGVTAAMAGEPCAIALPDEVQGESLSFDPTGDGIWTVSERELPWVNYTPLLPAE